MLYPIALRITGWPVIVVGGGAIGERRALGLVEAGARVTLVAPQATAALQTFAAEGRIGWLARPFAPGDVEGMRLVIAAAGAEPNSAVVAAARAAGILVNDAVDGDNGDVRIPAVHRTGPLTFAVETGGSSPSLARRLRRELAAAFDDRYGRAAESLRSLRDITAAAVPREERAALMEKLAGMPIDVLAAMSLSDRENAVEELLHERQAELGQLTAFTPGRRVCASRRSRLALAQARMVMAQLAQAHVASTLREVVSEGDRVTDRPIAEVGRGVFVSELEDVLRRGEADYAVHSCKDLPAEMAAELVLAAVPPRADARDAFCSERYATLAELPEGARVATSSPRRRAQLLLQRPDLLLEDVRGNIDTRLARLAAGEFDAMILAMAGMERLKIRARFVEALEPAVMLPAVAQGALAVQARAADTALVEQLRDVLNDPVSEAAVLAERAFLGGVRGGCQAPVAAYGVVEDARSSRPRLTLRGLIAAPSGIGAVRGEEIIELGAPLLNSATAEQREQLERGGARLARRLLDDGGRELLATEQPLRNRRILIGRTQPRPSRIAAALRSAGATVIEVAAGWTDGEELADADAILFPSSGAVAVFAPHRALLTGDRRPFLCAAMGPQSAAAAAAAGFTPQIVAPLAEIGAFVQLITHRLLEHDR